MKTSQLFAVLSVIVMISACGKGVHLTQPGEDKNAKVTNTENGSGKTGEGEDPKKVPVDNKDKSLVNQSDGQLTKLSVYDQKESVLYLIFNNKENPETALVSPGSPAFKSSDAADAVGINKASNLAFRAVVAVPQLDAVTEVVSLELELKGVTRYLEAGSKETGLQNQVLCLVDQKICSGQKDEARKANMNDAFWGAGKAALVSSTFSELKLGEPVALSDGGSYVSAAELKVDLLEAFGMKGKTAKEIMEWVYANSTEFAKPNYRKFRFSMGNSVYFESGQLRLVTNSLKIEQDAAGEPLNKDDLVVIKEEERKPVVITSAAPVVPVTPPADETGDEPTDTLSIAQLIESLKNGKVVKAKVDLSLAGTAGASMQDGKLLKFEALVEGKPFCQIFAIGADNKTIETEVALKSGTELSYVGTFDSWQGAFGLTVKSADGQMYAIRCAPSLNKEEIKGEITVEQLATAIGGILEITDASQVTVVTEPTEPTEPEPTEPTVTEPTTTLTGPRVELRLEDYNLQFALRESKLNKAAKAVLKSVANVLKSNEAAISKILLIGTTDHLGSMTYNLELAKARAVSVKSELLKNGVNSHIDYKASEILSSKCNTEDCPQDRKVEMQISISSELNEADRATAIQNIATALQALFQK